MKMSPATDELFKALFKVKQEIGSVTKNAKNPHFKNNYADLNAHIEALEPILQQNGLMLLQPPTSNDSGINYLTTILVHVQSGQFLQSEIALVGTPDMQKSLAAITYARRGSMNAIFGLASEDDDGETAVGRGASKQWEKKPAQGASTSSAKPKEDKVSEAPAAKAEVKGFTRQEAKAEVQSKPAPASNGAAKKGVIF